MDDGAGGVMTQVSEHGVTTPAPDGVARIGRPRDPSRDVAIAQATLDLLAEGGYAAVTMEAVAARAGVGKATLYRRFPAKEQLVVDALATLADAVEVPEDAGVRDQLVLLLETVRRKSSLASRILPRLVGEAVDNPELMRRYREQVVEPRRERLRAAVRRAIAEGLVRPDVDLDHVLDLLIGPLAYGRLLHPDRDPSEDKARRVVDDVLNGLTPRTTDQEIS
jgi:AcrR family transcriptional regulator